MVEYIEREAVLDYIRYKVCQGEGNIEHRCQRGSCAYCGICEIMCDISSMPAADVQPAKRGEWVNPKSVGNGFIYCSVCRNEAYWDTDYGQQLFDYCPYCGAKMKKPKQ